MGHVRARAAAAAAGPVMPGCVRRENAWQRMDLASSRSSAVNPGHPSDLLGRTYWRVTHMSRRQIALILILVVDVGYIAWGTGAAALPERLLGPGGKGIL